MPDILRESRLRREMCILVDFWHYMIEIPLKYRKLQTSSEREKTDQVSYQRME